MTDIAIIDDKLEREVNLLQVKHNLTEYRRNVVYHRLADPEALDPVIMERAGYSKHAIKGDRIQIMNHPSIVAALAEAENTRKGHEEASAERTIKELAHIAYAKATDFYEEDGAGNITLKSLDDLTDSQARAVSEINSVSVTTGETTRVTTKVKMHPKMDAIDKLGKHFGIFGDKDAPMLTINLIRQELGFED